MEAGAEMSARPMIQFARSGDVHIAYATFGQGDRNILVVPGWVTHLEQHLAHPVLGRMYERLAGLGRIAVFDKRGTGLSDRDVGVAALDERMDDLRAVMDAAQMERATVFGMSEGGPMALLFAATWPNRVDSLVVYGSCPTWRHNPAIPGTDKAEAFGLDMLSNINNAWGTGAGMEYWVGDGVLTDEMRSEAGQRLLSAAGPRDARRVIEMMLNIDVRDVLSTITAPALLVAMTEDLVAPPETMRWMADRIVGSTYVEVPGAHVPTLAGIDEMVDHIERFITGHEPQETVSVDRALATVLFTDIVDSTVVANELGDKRWSETLDRHDQDGDAVVRRHGGRLVKSTGDGILAVFDGPGKAVRAAQDLTTSARNIGIEIRAGLHCGEIELRGDDIAGIAVNLAARVMSQAQPGQVLVSRTISDLVFGSGLEFSSVGERDLKGIPGQWELLALNRT